MAVPSPVLAADREWIMPGGTRVVTSLTPGLRLLVSDLVQPQFTEEDRVARAVSGQRRCCARGMQRQVRQESDGKAPGVGAAAAQAPKVRGSRRVDP